MTAASLAAVILCGQGVARARPHAGPPVVVELFTAQGCADCVKADQRLADMAGRKGLIALTFPVDYWDYEGWTDTFADPAFSARQRAYARRLKVREIYTPEVVVDGAREASALDPAAVEALIAARNPPPAGAPRLALSASLARVRATPAGGEAGRASGGELWLVRYDPKLRSVKVKSGDNRGKTLAQRNVVRQLARLGTYAGRARTFLLPKPPEPGLATVVLLQAPRGGRVLATVAG